MSITIKTWDQLPAVSVLTARSGAVQGSGSASGGTSTATPTCPLSYTAPSSAGSGGRGRPHPRGRGKETNLVLSSGKRACGSPLTAQDPGCTLQPARPGHRAQSRVLSPNGRGGWTPLRPLRGLQETRVATLREFRQVSSSSVVGDSELWPWKSAFESQPNCSRLLLSACGREGQVPRALLGSHCWSKASVSENRYLHSSFICNPSRRETGGWVSVRCMLIID